MKTTTELSRWNPFRELEEFEKRARSWFARPQNGPMFLSATDENADWFPAMDVSEDDKEFTITADLPDVKKDDVKITLHEGLLTIHGERKHEEEEKTKKYHRVERSFGSYTRSFQLPKEVDSEKIEAQFEEGVLHVHLPKSPQSMPEEKEIKLS